MRKIKFLTAIALTTMPLQLIVTSCSNNSEKDIYRNVSFNENWKFRLNNDVNEQTINLPHDFSIIQDFDQHNGSGTTGFLPGGIGHYYKKFVLPKKDNASVIINFDGAYNDTEVRVNGTLVGNNKYGYNPFAFDITDYVTADGETENIIDVTVKHEHITSSRWYPGSGIYRDVNISVLDKIHVAYNGTYVTTPNLRHEVGKLATVNIDVDVDNTSDQEKAIYLRNRVVDQTGKVVTDWATTKIKNICGHQTTKYNCSLKVKAPKLWSAEDPNLYYVETQVVNEGKLLDQYKTRFGFRYYDFSEEGFSINGKRTKLHGVCLHHDQGALGAAAYNDAIYRQLTIMKKMGVNAVRTSHNCPDEDFLRICDELGFYVLDEAFDTWEFAKTGHDSSDIWKELIGQNNNLIDATPSMTWHAFVMHSMVKRDRNCPSVFMWSLGNELHEGEWHHLDPSDERQRKRRDEIQREMISYGHELKYIAESLDYDPNTKRWSGIALERNPNSDSVDANIPKCLVAKTLFAEGGPMGFNYGTEQQIEKWMEENPEIRLYGSETASARNGRGVYKVIREKDPKTGEEPLQDGHYHVTSYDGSGSAMSSEVIYRTLFYDGYAGQFIWTGFDYIGEPSPWCYNIEEDGDEPPDWPYPNSACYGMVDTAGFAKDGYYLYRSHLIRNETTLHLVGSLNEDNMYKYSSDSGFPEGYTPIDIYTNAPYVLIKADNKVIAKVTRNLQETSKGWDNYYTYEAQVDPSAQTICTIQDNDIKTQYGHGLYSNILVKPDGIKEIKAEAYVDPACQVPLTKTVGLSHLNVKNASSTSIKYYADKEEIKADGKSLSYVTIDLEDADHNLITDYDSQQNIEITWSGAGKVLGVDNGDQSTLNKWQNPNIFHPNEKQATIKTFAGKAVIIVCSDTTPGDINLTINGQKYTIKVV